MDISHLIIIAATLSGFFMAFALGANDVANSMAMAVGAKALTLRNAIIVAGILNFAGAVFLGSHVVATLSKGILNTQAIASPHIIILGMFAALLSSGLWILIATYTATPASSTHTIVGSLIGFGLAAGGTEVIYWTHVAYIILAWIIAPLLGMLIAFSVFSTIRKTILYRKNILAAARTWAPLWMASAAAIIVLSLCYKTPWGENQNLGWGNGLFILFLTLIIVIPLCHWYLAKTIDPTHKATHEVSTIFRKMQIGTACYGALSQGANDVANAIAPVLTIYYIVLEQNMIDAIPAPLWLLLLGGGGIAAGIYCLGYKVMHTVGERITKVNNTRGFSVTFSAATTVLMASNLGFPISTTHATVGSVVGVGLTKGFQAINFHTLGKILMCWLLTVPIAGATCAVIFWILLWCIPA